MSEIPEAEAQKELVRPPQADPNRGDAPAQPVEIKPGEVTFGQADGVEFDDDPTPTEAPPENTGGVEQAVDVTEERLDDGLPTYFPPLSPDTPLGHAVGLQAGKRAEADRAALRATRALGAAILRTQQGMKGPGIGKEIDGDAVTARGGITKESELPNPETGEA